MAAQLHGGALHVLAGERRQLLADHRRAGEGDLADHRVGDQVAGNLAGHAVHEVDRARRELAHDLVDREVPGSERRDRAHRLLDHQLVDALGARRDHAPVGAACLLGEPVDGVGAVQDLCLRLGERLALLHGHQRRDKIEALAHQAGGLAHDLRALEGRNPAPGGETLRGGLEGAVQVRALGMSERADLLAGGRVHDGKGAAGSGGAPGAVDVELGIWVHDRLDRMGLDETEILARASVARIE